MALCDSQSPRGQSREVTGKGTAQLHQETTVLWRCQHYGMITKAWSPEDHESQKSDPEFYAAGRRFCFGVIVPVSGSSL